MSNICKDYISDIIDEIALEGLDGITLQGLWLRLSDRPNFLFKPVDYETKSFLWRLIAGLLNVSFYHLPVERGNLVIFKRAEHIDATGSFYEPLDFVCVYPHAPVEDNGIIGSCSTYKVREDITSLVRKESYEEVTARGNTLVIVADQNARSKALESSDFNPCTELSVMQYCLLERIGRARYEGEVTQGKRGLRTVTNDPKLLYYFRKVLVKNKLVLKQVFYMKIGKQTFTGSLIHLPRFYREIRTKQDSDAIKLRDHLQSVPQNLVPLKTIKGGLNIDLKKLLLKYPKNFKTFQVPYRTINPNSKPTDWRLKSSGEEKSVRVVKLVDPQLGNEEDEEDDEDENSLSIESQCTGGGSLKKLAFDLVESAGPRGIKQTTIGNLLAVPSLQARSICKRLLDKSQCVQTALMDVGRQRTTHFYCSKFNSSKSSLTAEITEEKEKLLQAISLNNELVDENSSTTDTICNNTTNNKAECTLTVSDGQEISENSNGLVEESNRSFKSSDNIQAEIIICKQDTENVTVGIKEELKGLENKDTSNSVTARILRRAGLIVQAVNLHKVIQDTQKVQRIISDVEESEGLKQTIDRKTIQRLLDKLESDGLIRTIKVNLKGYGKEKTMLFICHPSVNETHSEIQSAIEQAKMKLPIISAHHTKKNLKKKNKIASYKHDISAGRKYGYKPKFIRMRILHSYMYYLIYGYDGSSNVDQSCKKEIVEKLGVDKSILEEMSFVYRTEIDWKMFLPPLPTHAEYPEGWCLLSDVLLRLPLYLFVSIVNVPFNIPGLLEYVEHPIRKYFLVKHLPSEILHHLTLMRKYIFVISEIVSRLGYIGLLQMGPQKLKEKDQVFIYLNRHAILMNTIPSDVGYNHISSNKSYETLHYTFNTIEDTENYWYDLWNFAMNTNLGNRNSMTGKPVVVESVTTKKELLAAIQPKSPEEVKMCDIGFLPGDNLGAGGLDSDMFVHLKRNWYWTGIKAVGLADQKTFLYPPAMKRPSKMLNQKAPAPQQSTTSETVKATKPKECRNIPEISKNKISRVGSVSWKSRAVSKKVTRILRQRKQKFTRKPYYDQKDKDALSRMVKLRVDWSPMEDNLLLICKVASLYMSPDKRRQIAKNFCAVREILHTTYPTISRNKTSRACQRRMHYMMRNPSTAQSVYLCLEEIKQDPEITSRFHRAVEKLDALLKSQGEGPKGYQKEYDKILENLVSTLLKKLKRITSAESAFCDIRLPNTVFEFEKKYNIVVPKQVSLRYGSFNEVQKTMDISASVINSVIHSSLCCAADKTSYSQQLFYIYQQYPDKLLRYVMAKCRSMSIVSCRKRYKRWKSAGNDCLPLASSPYQLSITYVHILQSKYQYYIFSECFNAFRHLISNAVKVTPLESPDQPPSKYSMKVEVNAGGESANIVELFSSDLIEMNVEFPDQLIVLDPRLSEAEESYKLIMKRFKELLNIIKDSRKKDKKSILDEEEEDDDDIDEDNDRNQNNEKDPYFEQFNLKNKTGVANTASRLALYLMRDEPLEHLDNSLQHAHDYFVLNPCGVTVHFDKEKAEKVVCFKDVKAKVLADIKRTATFPGEKRENQEIIDEIDSFPDELIQSLLEYLESKGDLGATYNEVMDKFQNCDEVMDLLSELVEQQFVLKSGVVDVRFIHNAFSKTWLVKSYYLLRQTRENMDCHNTQSAYAISFKGCDSSLKRKAKSSNVESQKDATNESCCDNESSSPPKKKFKASSPSSSNQDDLPTTPSTNNETLSNDNMSSVSNSNARRSKRLKLDENVSNNLGQSKDTANGIGSNTEQAINQNAKEGKTTSNEKHVENEQSRVLVKTMNKRWVTVPSENMKKFSDVDTMETKKVFVKVRPWIKIDGTLNRRVLDRLLGSVLGQCLTYPGISVKRLQDKFTPALQPTHTFELLEILLKIECIKLVKIKKSWKCSLFSERHQIATEQSKGIGDSTDVIVEPAQLAVSRLGYFIGDKNYTFDYLDALPDSRH